MLKLLIRRLFLIIPVSLLIAISVFFISSLIPGDRVSDYLDLFGTSSGDKTVPTRDYIKTAQKLNLNKPLFYFSLQPENYPDSINQIVIPEIKEFVINLAKNGIDNKNTFKAGKELTDLKIAFEENKDNDKIISNKLFELYNELIKCDSKTCFLKSLKNLKSEIKINSATHKIIENIENLILSNLKEAQVNNIIPKFVWHSTDNQFHKWFLKILHFDFGISIIDGRKSLDKIIESFPFTFAYVLIAYFLTLLISVIFGFISFYYNKYPGIRFLETLFSLIYSFPLFWISTLAVVLFTTDEILPLFNIFPSIGIGLIDPDDSIISKIIYAAPHLLLPSLVVAVHSAAYLGLLIRRNIEKEVNEIYYISLISKGIVKKRAIAKHILPNSLIPLVTIIIMGFPASLAGSVIIEVIFNIPGIGRLLYDSILRSDWSVVFPIVIIIGNLTYVFYVIGDLIYHKLNSKITLN
jgi:peptide/nickel transport system permease protein